MFGLTFWENWYLIGQNQPRETEFKFVYYTGKTLQNRYEGAFVYARKPELPQAAMPNIYKIAREAGLDPTRACAIDNACFAMPPSPEDIPQSRPPLFTPVATAGVLEGDALASLPTGSDSSSSSCGPVNTPLGVLTRLGGPFRDIAELLEDPKPPADELFGKQKPMYQVREYDANGYRVPGAGLTP